MRNRLLTYFMTVVAVACFFRTGPNLEAVHFPILAEQSISDVKRVDRPPAIVNQSITDISRTIDSVCFTWNFTKQRDVPLSYIGFPVYDKEGNIYDSVTTDMDRAAVVRINPEQVVNAVGVPQIRHYCTTLPYLNEDLTVRGFLVYKTSLNLWSVTHFTPNIVVPKE